MTQTGPLYDLAVIGGGINGAGVARDAAGRGARVLLLEAGDLGCGTSSASTKLIHGGLRYLEHYEFALVREALHERERLLSIAPHIIWPLRFVLPHAPGLRPRWLLRLGLMLYDHLGGRRLLPATRSIRLDRHPAGKPLKPAFRRGFEYSDGWVDDARLVVLNARDAAEHGADIRPRLRVTGLTRAADHWLITAGAQQFRAAALVNAAGPAVLDLLALTGAVPEYRMRLVRGSHIVVRKLFDHPYAYFFQLPDGRIFFAIPYERDFTLVGTTDRDHHGGLVDLRPSDEEVAYLCDGISQYFRQSVKPADVVWSFAGVRPLIDDGSGRPEAATRGYRLDLSEPDEGAPLLSIYGGKITTYRHLAEAAVNLLAARVAALRGPAWTGSAPLPGGDFPVTAVAAQRADLAARYPFLAPADIDRISKAYGTRASRWLRQAVCWDDLGEQFGAGLSAAEVDYLIDQEWAVCAEDVLWRRTKLGLRLSAAQQARLEDYLTGRRPG